MKINRLAIAIFVTLAALSAAAQSTPQKAFDQMKSLDGVWQGKDSEGKLVEVSFKETARGSALMSEIMGEDDMISMIHLDGPNRLLLTHYCARGNQPRMQASASPDGKTITFNFVEATNLESPDDGHMQSVIFTFVDANHHLEEWHFADHGKEHVVRFDLERKS